jgi:hypothetical protein
MIPVHPKLRLSVQDKEKSVYRAAAFSGFSSALIPGERIMFKLNYKLRAAMLIASTALCAAYSANSSAGDTFLKSTRDSKNLSDTGAPVTILSVTVPAGTWIVHAKANPVSFGAADYVRCRIMVGTSQKDAGATLLGNAAPGPTGEMGPSVATIALQTVTTTTASKVFMLDCQHDFPTPGIYVDPGASLIVSKAP